MAMHATVRDHSHEMRRAATGLECRAKILDGCVIKERAIFDRQVDLPEVHRHNTSRADIGMADFRISHLSAREPNIRAMRNKRRIGAVRHHIIKDWRLRQHGRICL